MLCLRIAQTRVDPVSFANALVVWGHIVDAGVEVEHEEEITNGANNSDRGGKMLLTSFTKQQTVEKIRLNVWHTMKWFWKCGSQID